MFVNCEDAGHDTLQLIELLRALGIDGLLLVLRNIIVVGHAVVFQLVVVEHDVLQPEQRLEVRIRGVAHVRQLVFFIR